MLSSICGESDIITPLQDDDNIVRQKMGYIGAQNYYVPMKYYGIKDWKRFFLKREKKK